jgi:hypothetical protein
MAAGRIRRAFVGLYLSVTIGFLLVLSALILAQPKFPLSVGMVRTTGRAGLLVSLLPALLGGGGLVLLRSRRKAGALLVAAYSVFWAVVFLAGLPQVWNARQSFCLKGLGFCITSPWIARLTVFAIAAVFLLCAWWALGRVFAPPAREAGKDGT